MRHANQLSIAFFGLNKAAAYYRIPAEDAAIGAMGMAGLASIVGASGMAGGAMRAQPGHRMDGAGIGGSQGASAALGAGLGGMGGAAGGGYLMKLLSKLLHAEPETRAAATALGVGAGAMGGGAFGADAGASHGLQQFKDGIDPGIIGRTFGTKAAAYSRIPAKDAAIGGSVLGGAAGAVKGYQVANRKMGLPSWQQPTVKSASTQLALASLVLELKAEMEKEAAMGALGGIARGLGKTVLPRAAEWAGNAIGHGGALMRKIPGMTDMGEGALRFGGQMARGGTAGMAPGMAEASQHFSQLPSMMQSGFRGVGNAVNSGFGRQVINPFSYGNLAMGDFNPLKNLPGVGGMYNFASPIHNQQVGGQEGAIQALTQAGHQMETMPWQKRIGYAMNPGAFNDFLPPEVQQRMKQMYPQG